MDGGKDETRTTKSYCLLKLDDGYIAILYASLYFCIHLKESKAFYIPYQKSNIHFPYKP